MHGESVRERLSRKIYKELKRRIVNFEIPPGTPLLETRLVKEFSVSRTPVREALQLLRTERLVEFREPLGAAVLDASFRTVVETYNLRELICPYAARLAAEEGSEEEIEELCKLVSESPARGNTTEDRVACETANRHFHVALLEMSGNKALSEIGERLLWVTQQVSVALPNQSYRTSKDEHSAIVDCLRARDASGAEETMRAHIRGSRGRCFPTLET